MKNSDLLKRTPGEIEETIIGKAALQATPRMRWRCRLCGRNRFTSPTPHNCEMGFLKHYNRAARVRGLETIWEKVYV